jgi:hypothetical protein
VAFHPPGFIDAPIDTPHTSRRFARLGGHLESFSSLTLLISGVCYSMHSDVSPFIDGIDEWLTPTVNI